MAQAIPRRAPVLAVALLCALLAVLASAFAGSARAAVGDFHPLASSAVPLTSVTVDPNSNLVYAQEFEGTRFFRYDPRTDAWTELTASPLNSGNDGGAAFLDGKIYTSYTQNSTNLGVYDIASDTWTTIPNPLGSGTGDITAVGGSLYMVRGTHFVKYDPATDTTTPLANAPDFATGVCGGGGYEAWGGLQPLDGKIYGHQGDGCDGFAVYDIASDSWTELARVPDDVTGSEGTDNAAVLGSAIDPVSRTYFTYGGYGENHFFRYDIASNTWSAVDFPFSNLDDGGMAYVSLPGQRGVYAGFGENGTGFTRYETPEPAPAQTAQPAQPLPPAPVVTVTPRTVVSCVVPNLQGRTLAKARALLKANHCGLGKVRRKASSARRTGSFRVVAQSTKAGSVRAAGTRVSVSLGRNGPVRRQARPHFTG